MKKYDRNHGGDWPAHYAWFSGQQIRAPLVARHAVRMRAKWREAIFRRAEDSTGVRDKDLEPSVEPRGKTPSSPPRQSEQGNACTVGKSANEMDQT